VTFTYDATEDRCLAAPLTVQKTVVGPVAPGTTFTEHLACTEGSLIVPLGAGDSTTERDFVFTVDADGVAQPAVGHTVSFTDPDSCTVTETVDGGASGVSYSCASVVVPVPTEVSPAAFDPAATLCSSAGPTDTPISVAGVSQYQRVVLTVTNTFEPTFTG